MSFTQEQTGYEKTILSDLQGAWQALRDSVVEAAGFDMVGTEHCFILMRP